MNSRNTIYCALCYNKATNPVKTPCNHYFCMSCLQEWLGTSSSCPVFCAGSLTIEDLDMVNPEKSIL